MIGQRDAQSQIQYRLIDELSANERRYRELIGRLHEVVVEVDERGIMTFLNPAWTSELGHAIEDSIGRGLDSFTHPSRREALRQYLESRLTAPSDEIFELQLRTKTGEHLWCELTVRADESHRRTGILRNVDSRRRLEAAREEEAAISRLRASISATINHFESAARMLDACCKAILDNTGAFLVRIWTFHEGKNTLALQCGAHTEDEAGLLARALAPGIENLGSLARGELTLPVPARPGETARLSGEPTDLPKLEFAGIPLIFGERMLGMIGMILDDRLSAAARVRVKSVASDISLGIIRKETEATIRENMARFEMGASLAGLAVGEVDIAGGTINLSGGSEMLGLSPGASDIPFGKLLSRVHPEDRDTLADQFNKSLDPGADGFFETETRFIARNGQTRWHIVRNRVIFETMENKPLARRAILAFHDITSRKLSEIDRVKSERELDAVSRRLRAVLDSATQISIIAADPHGLITIFNTGAERLLGYSAAEVVGRRNPMFIHLEEEVETRRRELAATRAGETTSMDVFLAKPREGGYEERTWTYVRRDGTRVPVNLGVTALRDSNGEINGFLGIAQDITAQISAEQKLRAAAKAAETANQAKSLFLANISHEVRTPMGAILGYTEMLRDSGDRGEDQTRIIEAIRRNGEHLLNIINDVLDLSKIESDQFEVERIPFDPTDLLREAVASAKANALHKGLDILLDLPEKLPERLFGDPKRLRQILDNLLVNAVKFSDRGRIETRVAKQKTPGGNLWLTIEVEDHGIGMSDAQMTRLFQPFSQADPSHSRRYGGTGLGLSICKRLALAMGGDIAVRSAPGVGTCFILRLPMGTTDATVPAPRRTEKVAPTGPKTVAPTERVLLAEDSPDNQIIIRHFLEKAGYRVEIVSNGVETIRRLAGESFDLILMDMQMPEMDGYEATRRLRAAGRRIPVIALTANAMRGDDVQCLEAGCDAYLAKPLNPETLLATIRRHLDHPTPTGPESFPSGGSPLETDRGRPSAPVAATSHEKPSAPVGDPQSELQKIIADYVGGLPARLAGLKEAIGRGNRKFVARACHQLKSSAPMHGLPGIGELMETVEAMALGSDSSEEIESRISAAEEELLRITGKN